MGAFTVALLRAVRECPRAVKIDPEYNTFRIGWWLGRIDSRPVAVFRIVYGALLLKDALFHIPLARLLYSDQGILPRAALLSPPPGPYRFSLMDAVGPPWLAVAFFLLWALVSASLMVGYRTRLAALLGYVFLVSVQYRNGYVLDGSDAVFRVLGFWAVFLPLGDHYGLDALTRRLRAGAAGAPAPSTAPAWALPLRMAQLQVAIIYLVTAAEKLRSGAWLNGDALFYTMQLKTLTLPLGDALFDATPPSLLRGGGVAVVLVEWAIPFLLLSPIGQPSLRLLGMACGVLLHGGIALTMSIPNFSLLMLSAYWLFARGVWVEALERRLRSAWAGRSARPPGLCWRAAVAYARRAGRLGPLRVPVAPSRVWRAAQGVALVFVLASIVWHNTWAVYYPLVPPPRGPALSAVLYLALWQRWDMFLGGGRRPDGWVDVAGVHEDGRVLDLFHRGPVSQEAPRRYAGPWKRWSALERVVEALPPAHLASWARSACRWSPSPPLPGRRLVQVELRYHFRVPHAPGRPREPLQSRLLWREGCLPAAPGSTR